MVSYKLLRRTIRIVWEFISQSVVPYQWDCLTIVEFQFDLLYLHANVIHSCERCVKETNNNNVDAQIAVESLATSEVGLSS